MNKELLMSLQMQTENSQPLTAFSINFFKIAWTWLFYLNGSPAAINKVKDRPIVFATVANPFIIGLVIGYGSSSQCHLQAAYDRMMEVVTNLPGN
jgi:hypothetical protein